MSDLVIPVAAIRHNLIALGKTRAGKSSKLRVLTEYLLEGGSPVCIIDPKGDWWGLKSSGDGKRAGFPIVIFGGDHADVPINEHSGAHVAEIVATGNRPALIDLGGWMVGQRTRFFVDFAATFFKLARGSRHLVIDEVHNFAPQGRVMDPDAGKMLHWANRLASEGSGKGITIYAASQRPQKVHKDFVTSCETLIACKVIHKLDRDAIKDWIDGCADATKSREVIADLAQLKKPEAWVWCPEVDFGPQRITFPMYRTYDSFKPQPADGGKLKGWAEIDLEDVKVKLATVVQEAEANDPKRLKAEVARLTKLLDARPPEVAPTNDDELVRSQQQEIERQRGVIATLEGDNRALEQNRDAILSAFTTLQNRLDGARGSLDNALRAIGDRTEPPAYAKPSAPAPAARSNVTSPPVKRAATPAPRISRGNGTADTTMEAGPRRCLTAAAQYADRGGIDKKRLRAVTGYASRTIENHVSNLRVAGYVNSGWPLMPLAAGIRALGDYEPLPSGDALRDWWLTQLEEGPRRILSLLAARHGRGLSKADVIEHSQYASRTVENHMSALRVRHLVYKTGNQFHASEDLFG